MTKQLDATMYGDGGGILPITNMPDPINLVLERMRSKDPDKVLIPGTILTYLNRFIEICNGHCSSILYINYSYYIITSIEISNFTLKQKLYNPITGS